MFVDFISLLKITFNMKFIIFDNTYFPTYLCELFVQDFFWGGGGVVFRQMCPEILLTICDK